MRISILQITKDCNQDCFYCCRDRNAKEESLDELKHHIDTLENTDQVIITGGEPTLKKDLPEIIRYAKKRIQR